MSIDTRTRVDAAQERRVARAEGHVDRWQRVAERVRAGRWQVTVVAALAVALSSLCLAPLLDGQWWFARIVAAVAVVAVTGALARSLFVPAALAPLLEFAALMTFLTWSFAREDALWGFAPGTASLTRLQDLVAQGRAYAMDTQPPVGPDLGLLLLIVAGVGLVALVVDTIAAGLDLPGLTLAPLAALFLVPWVINRGTAPWWAFAVVALGWLAILWATQRDRAALWSPGARPGSAGTGLVIAGLATVLALLAGSMATLRGPAGPVGPAAGSGGSPVQIDALVSLRRSLVNNDTRAVLTYEATTARPDYLRLSILEDFDGEAWRPIEPNQIAGAPPAVGGDGPAPSWLQPPAGPVAEYQFDVGPLAGSTLPSPRGTFASLNDWTVMWDQRTSLPFRADGRSIEGTNIGLLAAEQNLDSAGLREASVVPPRPEQVFSENLEDPSALVGEDLAELAREVTAGATSPFDAALALQRWFSTEGGFSYSTQIDGGSDSDALAAFLDERVGYCEQFAATMALMARSVGVPARVAVGFTQGRRDGSRWEVQGVDAHAWPELWMGTAGWIRFEPTPGAPTAATPRYTVGTGRDVGTDEAPVEESLAPVNEDPSAADQGADDAAAVAGVDESEARQLPVGWIVGVLLAALLLMPWALRVLRRRRRMAGGDGESSYREVVDTMIDLHLGGPAATPRATLGDVADLVGGRPERGGGTGTEPLLDDPATALAAIQRAVEWQRYGKPGSAAGPPDGSHVIDLRTSGVTPVERRGTTIAQAGVLVADQQQSGQLPGAGRVRPGDEVRVVRRALANRAGRARRIRAALMPASVLASLVGRRPGEATPGSG